MEASDEEEMVQAKRVVATGARVLVSSKNISKHALRYLRDNQVCPMNSKTVIKASLGNGTARCQQGGMQFFDTIFSLTRQQEPGKYCILNEYLGGE